MSLQNIRNLIPALAVVLYGLVYSAVLMKNVFWSVGDQTDVIRCGIAALPLGYVISFVYPGGRTGAFVAVTLCAALNICILYFGLRHLLRPRQPAS